MASYYTLSIHTGPFSNVSFVCSSWTNHWREKKWQGSCSQAQYGIASGSLVVTMRDRASVNNLAMSIVKIMYPQALDVGATLSIMLATSLLLQHCLSLPLLCFAYSHIAQRHDWPGSLALELLTSPTAKPDGGVSRKLLNSS